MPAAPTPIEEPIIEEPIEEPTEEQIRTAYAASLAALNGRSVAIMGAEDAQALTLVLDELKKLGCRGLDRPGAHFDCRVERRLQHGKRKAKTDVVQLWLAYEEGQWVAR